MRFVFPLLPILFCTLRLSTASAATLAADTPPPAVNSTPASTGQPFQTVLVTMMAKNCYGCHNAKLSSGGLNLKALADPQSLSDQREKWEAVLRKLQAGEMPPKGMPRPSIDTVKTVTQWIQSEFDRLDAQLKPDPGRVTAHRLNRSEYNNTIRDLLAVDFPAADDFPQDDSGYGFDNIGDSLSLPPVLLGKYLTAAEKIVHLALEGPPELKPTVYRYQPPALSSDEDKLAGADQVLPYTVTNYDLSGLSLRGSLHTIYRFPAEADYTFRISPGGNRPAPSDPFDVVLWLDGAPVRKIQFRASKSDTGMEGEEKEARLHVTAGKHEISISALKLFEGLPAKYGGLNPTSQPPVQPRPFEELVKLSQNATVEEKAVYEKKKANYEKRVKEPKPPKMSDISFRISFLDIIGPFDEVRTPARTSLKKVYVCGHMDGHHTAACPRKILADFTRRAYRRPVAPDEVNRIVELFTSERAAGSSFTESLATAMEAVLVSPHFLFRIERDPQMEADDTGHFVGQYELASRLSYFLWSSLPDDQLLKQAAAGNLRSPAVLKAQIRRMLRDPKADALVNNFGGQWLQFRALESAKPDPEHFPLFSDYLRMSMQTETELFFNNLIHEDRSILDLLNGKYSFVNEELARFYGIPGVSGPEFRRVDLTGTQRSGVLTQGSVLMASSYSTRTSVVLRGKWVLENLLNAPVPPPPPNVPALNEAAVGTSMSLRQQMEQHRANPICSSCHSRMDPIGFGLENYDAVGHWRTQDGKFPIDATGTLPNGRSFNGATELTTVLLDQKDAFVKCVTEKLLTYALGRGLERYDRPTVKEITTKLVADNYRFTTLVEQIAGSLPFQKRRGDVTVYVSQK